MRSLEGAGSPPAPPDLSEIDPGNVRTQLARILASDAFNASPRNRAFLRYIIEEALAGRGDRIKAYSIAVGVFGRDSGFDPQNDPIVRIEASRLRRSLEHYYIVAGERDSIRVEVPKGGYVPTFRSCRTGGDEGRALQPEPAPGPDVPEEEAPDLPEHREGDLPEHREGPTRRASRPALVEGFRPISPRGAWGAAALGCMAFVVAVALWTWTAATEQEAAIGASGRGPSLIVLPFENLSAEPAQAYLAKGITEEITTALAQFDELFVYAPETGTRYGTVSYGEIHRELGVRYVLQGSVREAEGHVRVTARLVDAEAEAQLWAAAYDDVARSPAALFKLQSDIARRIITEVAQPHGAITAAGLEVIGDRPPESLSAYECVLQVIDYYRHMSPARVEDACACLERATESDPGYAEAWALLGMSYLDHVRLRMVPRSDDEDFLDRALHAARTAVELEPRSALAHQSLMLAHSFRGEAEEAVAAGARAVALNPNNSEILAGHGMRLALMGQWERGLALLKEAIARNPAHPGWYHAAPALNLYRQGRYAEALEEALQIDAPDWVHSHVILAMIYGQLGRNEEARAAIRKILEMDPEFGDNVWYELRLRNLPQDVREHIADGLRKAGLSIPRSRRLRSTALAAPGGRPRKPAGVATPTRPLPLAGSAGSGRIRAG